MKLHIPTGPAVEASQRSLSMISKIMLQSELDGLSHVLKEFNCEDAQVFFTAYNDSQMVALIIIILLINSAI